MKQIVPSIIWAVSIVVWLVVVLGTVVLRSVRALLVRLARTAGRPSGTTRTTSSGEHGSPAGGCRGC